MLFAQLLGICDSLAATFVSPCRLWLCIGSVLFVTGPAIFLAFLGVRLRKLRREGELVFVSKEKKTWREICRGASSKGLLGLPIMLPLVLQEIRSGGEWQVGGVGKYYLWAMGDFSGSGWFYPMVQVSVCAHTILQGD